MVYLNITISHQVFKGLISTNITWSILEYNVPEVAKNCSRLEVIQVFFVFFRDRGSISWYQFLSQFLLLFDL